jgi:beta-mannosidase
MEYSEINLVFEGVDTYSTIKFNEQLIEKTNNSFVEYRVNIKNLVKLGDNLL